MNHSNEIMPKDRITVMAKSKKDVHAMDEESYIESEWCYSMSSEHDDEIKRSKSDTTYGEASSKNHPSNSQRRSQSNTRQMQSSRKESRAIVQHAPRTPNTEPDLSIIVGDRDFHYFSQVIAYMSDYLSQQMVQIEDEKLRIDFSHKNAKEWEQFIYPLLEKHARSKRLTKSSRLINQSNLAVVLPWFQEFGMQELLHDSDELLASLPFVTPAIAGSSVDNDEHRSDVSGQDVQDAVSLLHIAFSCALPHTQTRAAELVHKYLQHSPKTWLLLDQQRSDEDEEDDDEEEEEEDGGTLSIFVQLAQVLQENPKCREFLFSRYSPNILEIYLPSEVFPCDKDSQSDWFWEEMVANPLFPFLLRERMKSFVRKIEQSQSPPQPVETPTVEPEKPKAAVDPPASLSWQAMMSWIPSFQRPPTQLSRQLTEDEGDDEEDDYDEEEDDDDSVINERSQLIHDVLDKIREPQHNFPRRPRSSTALITIPSRRNLRLNGTIPPPMPVLHEQMASKEVCGGDSVGTPVRVRKPTCSTVSASSTTGSPSSAISNDMVSLSSASVTTPSVSGNPVPDRPYLRSSQNQKMSPPTIKTALNHFMVIMASTAATRKRLHPDNGNSNNNSTTPRLSVIEFCAVLNGSNNDNDSHDAEDLLQTLQQFVKVVRSQRRMALRNLSVVEEDNDQDNDDDDEDVMDHHELEDPEELNGDDEQIKSTSSAATAKRFKKDESWKEDTKSYQVPFVGTSQATTIRQHDYGQVVEKTWPCGLLQAYLIKSPLMRELLVFDDISSSASNNSNNNSFLPRHILRRIPPRPNTISSNAKQHDKKKSQHFAKWQAQLLKAYLLALREVMTAILPAHQYTTTLSDTMQQRLISLFQNQVMPVVWKIVEQQPHHQQQASDASYQSVCVPIAMQMLVRMASVSVASARQVAHHLTTTTKLQTQSNWFHLMPIHAPSITATAGDTLSKQHSAESLATAFKVPTNQVEDALPDTSKTSKDTKITKPVITNATKHAMLAQQTCRAALCLVTTLCEWNDPGLLATIMSAGAKERKLPPGLLYTVLRATRLWKSVASTKATTPEDTPTTGTAVEIAPSVSFVNASLGRLLRALCIALQEGVLRRRQKLWLDLWSSGGDAWQNLIQLASLTPVTSWNQDTDIDMATETQQLQPHNQHQHGCVSSQEAGRLLTLFLTNTQGSPLLLLLNSESVGDHDTSTVHAKSQASQQLVRSLTYLLDHRPLYGRHELMALHAFVLQCLRITPALAQPFFRTVTIPEVTKPYALVARWHLISKYLTTVENQTSIAWSDKLKHVLSKALQSSNAMVVAETLKLILNLLKSHIRSDKTQRPVPEDVQTRANKSLESNSFFELQVLLSVRSRWNPFTRKKATSDMLIVIHLCQLLHAIANLWPRILTASKYDWMKLLPPTAAEFTRSHPLLQVRLFRTLQTLLELQLDHESNAKFSASSIRIVLEIMIESRTTSPQVSNIAAQVVLLRFRRLLLNGNLSPDDNDPETLELSACVEYEWECWLKGLTNDILSSFLTVVENAGTKKSSHVVSAAVAWEKAGLPGCLTHLPVSPILLSALLEQQGSNPMLDRLTSQVAGKCLLFQRCPLPLAALICCKNRDDPLEERSAPPLLYQYAASLVGFDARNEAEQSNLLTELTVTIFGNDTAPLKCHPGNDATQWNSFAFHNGYDVAVRLLFHLVVGNRDTSRSQSVRKPLQTILLPLVVQRKCDVVKVKSILHYLYDVLNRDIGYPKLYFDIALLSCPASSTLHSLLDQIISFLSFPPHAAERNDVLTSAKVNQSLLLSGIWKDFLPPSAVPRSQETLLLTVTNDKVIPSSALTKLLFDWLSANTPFGVALSIPLGVAFRAWCIICKQSSEPELSWRIARQLELMICKEVTGYDDGVISTQLYALVQQESVEVVIENCLRSKHALISQANDGHTSCLLKLILSLDVCNSLPIFFHKLSGMEKSNVVADLFGSPALDSALIFAADYLDLLQATTRENVSQKLICKARNELSNKEKLELGESNTFVILTKFMAYECGTLDMLVTFGEVVSLLIDCFEVPDPNTRSIILSAARCVCLCFRQREQDGDSFQKTKGQWVSNVLVRLCNELPKRLRGLQRGDERERDVVLKHLSLLQLILQESNEMGVIWGKTTAVCLGKLLKSCLKHGVTDELTEEAVSVNCLRLARAAFVEIERIRLSGFAGQVHFIRAPILFRMIVTHSKFQAALELERDEANLPKLELVLLLLCCVSMARGDISFEKTFLNLLSSNFNAGVTVLDAAIRRLIQVYTETVAERPAALRVFAEQFRWTKQSALSGADLSASGTAITRWEWLVNTLDPERVRETLRRFPTSDSVIPLPLPEERQWTSWNDTKAANENFNADCDGRSEDLEANGPDVRYSPGFVLPMILACLEDVFPGDHKLTKAGLTEFTDEASHEQGVAKETEFDDSRAFVLAVKRFFDLGTLSFALGALSSMCPVIRKVAVSILAIILKTLSSQEAADLTEWRERPQLQMLVNSIQRSLVVRKAEQRDESDSYVVRRLPSVTAIFLARAAAAVAKPGDTMFAPINRFFLKVDVEHGAFQDLTRLPAFVSLFCSSSEEPPGQSQRERVWALRLLEEGLLDETCYRLVAACHAPALLQTFLVSVRPFELQKYGRVDTLIIRTLSCFLAVGGHNARMHLIGRTGLLSLLRCLLSDESLLSTESVPGFFLLMQQSVQGAMDLVNSGASDAQTLIIEVVALVKPTVDLAARLFDPATSVGGEGRRDDDSLNSGFRKLLRTLQLAMQFLDPGDTTIRQDGVSLTSATRLLLGTGCDWNVLLSLCALPVLVHTLDTSAVEKFCNVAMMIIHANQGSMTSCDVEAIMTRIIILLRSVPTRKSEFLLKSLIACRGLCFRSGQGKLAWIQCMDEIALGAGSDLSLLDLPKLAYSKMSSL